MKNYYENCETAIDSAAEIIRAEYNDKRVYCFVFYNKQKGYYLSKFKVNARESVNDFLLKQKIVNFNSSVITLVHNDLDEARYYNKVDRELITKGKLSLSTIYLVSDSKITYQYYPKQDCEVISI